MVGAMVGARVLHVHLAKPRGFCAGVVRAVETVERLLERHGAPVYVRHQIVHNRHVVEALTRKGAVFVDEVDAIPRGAVTVFSAHGVPTRVEKEAAARDLDVIDATCPLVQRVHVEGRRYAAAGYDVVLVGHAGHAEVEGTRGRIDGRLHVIASAREARALEVADESRVAYITQTTLSIFDTAEIVAALKERFPAAVGPELRDICYATQNRQQAVTAMAGLVDLVLVVGSANSSNSARLAEIARSLGVPAHLVDDASEIDERWLDGIDHVGLTAGASAPEHLVQEVLERLGALRPLRVDALPGIEETVRFRPPARLAEAARR